MSQKPFWEQKNKWLGVPNMWIIIFCVFIVMFTGYGAGVRRQAKLKSGQEYIEDVIGPGEPGWEPPEGPPSKYDRASITISVITSQNDWQAGGAASPTTPVYTYFYDKPSKDDTGEAMTVGGEDVTIKASNDGIIWVDCYGGTDFFLVKSAFMSANTECEDVLIEDYNEDGDLDFLAKFDLSDFLMGEQSFKPSFTISMPLLDLDHTGWDDDDPADQTSIGTSETVINIEWQYSNLAAEDGGVISELYFVTNSTRQGEDVRLEELYLGGQWTVLDGKTSWDSPIDYTYGDYTAYYIKASQANDPLDPGCVTVYRDTNKADTFDISLNIRCTFESGDQITIDIYMTLVGPDGTITEETDSVQIDA